MIINYNYKLIALLGFRSLRFTSDVLVFIYLLIAGSSAAKN